MDRRPQDQVAAERSAVVDPPGVAETFAQRLDAALAASRYSIPALSRRLSDLGHPLSPATLRSWRTGRRQPEHLTSLDAVGILEDLLDVPARWLTGALAPPRRRGPRPLYTPIWQLVEPVTITARLMERLGLAVDDGLEVMSEHHLLEVDAHRLEQRLSQRAVRRAADEGIDRYAIVLVARNPVVEPPRIRATMGGAIGDSAFDLEAGVFVWTMRLTRPMHAGEVLVTEHVIDFPPDRVSSNSYRAYVDARVPEVAVIVRFDGAAAPADVDGWVVEEGQREEVAVTATGSTFSVVRRDVRPGEVGLRWCW